VTHVFLKATPRLSVEPQQPLDADLEMPGRVIFVALDRGAGGSFSEDPFVAHGNPDHPAPPFDPGPSAPRMTVRRVRALEVSGRE
jgi:hypothetical protein